MSDFLLILGVAIASSFVATFGIARRLKAPEPLTELERVRIELDAVLDNLEPYDLQEVRRVSQELLNRRAEDERRSLKGITPRAEHS